MKIDRQIAHKSLTDGFCEIFGEELRDLLTKVGNELIDLGIKNGQYIRESAFNHIDKILSLDDNHSAPVMFPKDKVIEQLLMFFTKEQVDKLVAKANDEKLYFAYSKTLRLTTDGIGEYQSQIVSAIDEKKAPKFINTKHFDYFKTFYVYGKSKSCNLFGECGMGLDMYNAKDVRYYFSENELCYPIKAISRKYHLLGSYIAREEYRQELIDKIISIGKELLPPVCHALSDCLREVCFDSELEPTLLDIQDKTGITDDFLTSKQVSQRLSKISKAKWDEMFNIVKGTEDEEREYGQQKELLKDLASKLRKINNK